MKLTTCLGALAVGLALVSTAAIAQEAPLSPGGISAPASAFGGPGPGYIGPRTHVVTPRMERGPLYNYVPAPSTNWNVGPTGAPLSPGGISAPASAFGGPGYNPPGGLGGR